ncbi:MAG: hypothetical protein ABIF85_05600 [Nanoarchaeota archaeon]|nr:hypothetical protein [Nanoarchaeota archaeon]MBU4301093.1 hypothetical protein [Nanoarchaeota archaeon]MBU4451909.1 hypothetical protein [Nanoarchaeota archaeon]MCG2724606.1 hypothetical protein [archaeon]
MALSTSNLEEKLGLAITNIIEVSPNPPSTREGLFQEIKRQYPALADEKIFDGAITPELFERIKKPGVYIDEAGKSHRY